jgi:hypothetical protein
MVFKVTDDYRTDILFAATQTMRVLAFLPQAHASANIITYSNAESETANTLNAKAKVAQNSFRISNESSGT